MSARTSIQSYRTIRKTFGTWISPIFTGFMIALLRILIRIGLLLDHIFYPSLNKITVSDPLVIVGNPRSGTTFLHRFLINSGFGVGSELWQMIYPSIVLQKLLKPILPILEKISPARHHSTAAHQTSLTSVETDDVSLLFRYFDGFFLYGFILAFADEDLFDTFDPKKRDTTKRDFNWFHSVWSRRLIASKGQRMIPKLFSVSTTLPAFLQRFQDAKILYLIRDPLNVLPSGLSLVTGVLDKKFGFWNLPEEKRNQYLGRLYNALLELLKRFHSDFTSGKIDRSKVLIIQYKTMMTDFEKTMDSIFQFIGEQPTEEMKKSILSTAESQRNYVSKHSYDLAKFGLTKEKIRTDCAFIYDTFLKDD